MPPAIPIFQKNSDERQVIYFTRSNNEFKSRLQLSNLPNNSIQLTNLILLPDNTVHYFKYIRFTCK